MKPLIIYDLFNCSTLIKLPHYLLKRDWITQTKNNLIILMFLNRSNVMFVIRVPITEL